MGKRAKQQVVSRRLSRVRGRVEQWRAEGGGRGRRMPAALWAAAGEVARAEGVYRVSKALRLDYTRLKHWAAQKPSAQEPGSEFAFVELEASPVCGGSHAVIEVAGRDGERLRMELSGRPQVDVVGLVQTLLGVERPCFS